MRARVPGAIVGIDITQRGSPKTLANFFLYLQNDQNVTLARIVVGRRDC